MGEVERYTPLVQEVELALELLENRLKDMPVLLDWSEYRVQLFGYLNELGEKNLWANYFCYDFALDWKTELVGVDDGGSCYFNVKVNLDQKKIFDLEINGPFDTSKLRPEDFELMH